jgi:hypothetical protein
VAGTFPCAKVCNARSYKNAQYFAETEQYPSRYDRSWALFGNVSSLEIIVPFDSEDVAPELRRRRAGVTDFSPRGGRNKDKTKTTGRHGCTARATLNMLRGCGHDKEYEGCKQGHKAFQGIDESSASART